MNPLLALALHLTGFVLGILILRGLARSGLHQAKSIPCAVGVSAAMVVFLFVVSEPPAVFEDFRHAYLAAGRAVLDSPAALAPMIEKGVHGFVNLPIVAYVFWPLAWLPTKVAASLFAIAGLFCAIAAWRLLVLELSLHRASAALLLLAFAASGPLANSIKEGNTSHFLLWPLVGAMVLLRRGDDLRAGVVLGLIGVVKLPLLLFAAYYIVRGRWRVTVGSGLVCIAAVAISVAVFGWDLHARWFEVGIRPYLRDPIPAFNVQSIPAFVSRLQLGAAGLRLWDAQPLTGWGSAVSSALTALLYGSVLWVVYRGRNLDRMPHSEADSDTRVQANTSEFSLVLAVACVSSTLAWSHYFCWFLIPAALFLRNQSVPARVDGPTHWLGWISLLVCSVPVLSIQWAHPETAEVYAKSGVSALLLSGIAWIVWLGRLTIASSDARLLTKGHTGRGTRRA